jgi:hypothetical protein
LPAGSLSLLTQVRRGFEGVVEPVREVSDANQKHQLDNLSLVEEFVQIGKIVLTDSCGPAGDAISETNDSFLLIGKMSAAPVELEVCNLFRRDADPLRRSEVGARSIFAPVDHRRLQVREFLELRINGAFCGDSPVERRE